MTDIPWQSLLASTACVAGVFALLRLWVSSAYWFAADQELQRLRPPALHYEVVPVNPAHVQEYHRMNPLHPQFQDFVDAVLNNQALAEHHDSIQAALKRNQTMHAGMLLFVRVVSMP